MRIPLLVDVRFPGLFNACRNYFNVCRSSTVVVSFTAPGTPGPEHRIAADHHKPISNRGRGTQEKILDAAEKLFARRGFHGVSIRDITSAAGVDVALANYHFATKRGLFDAVFLRRAEILNAERLALLEAVRRRAAPRPPTVEDVIDAFTHPLLNRSARGGAGWKSYFGLIAQVNNSPEWGGQVMTRYFDPLVHKFIDALREALPQADPRDLYWSYHFLSGALTLTFAETGRIDNLSGGLCRSNDLDSVHERMVPFIASGFRALCERTQRRAAARRRKQARKRAVRAR